MASHGTHGSDPLGKSAINNALLSYLCRGENGMPCSGHGVCQQGVCICDTGYNGTKCEVEVNDRAESSSNTGSDVDGLMVHDNLGAGQEDNGRMTDSCLETDHQPCEGHGVCNNGACDCDEGYSGFLCELSSKVGFCRTYKECAKCISFMRKCPDKCEKMANFKHVYGFPVNKQGVSFRRCRFKDIPRNCTFYFQEEGEDERGMKTIMVKTCLAYHGATVDSGEAVEQSTDRPMVPDMTSDEITQSPEDPGTQDKQAGNEKSGQDIITLNILTIVSSLALLNL